MEPWRFEVPVDGQHALAGARQDPRHVRQQQRPPGPALVRIERDDLCVCRHQSEPLSVGGGNSSLTRRNTCARSIMVVLIACRASENWLLNSAGERMSPRKYPSRLN